MTNIYEIIEVEQDNKNKVTEFFTSETTVKTMLEKIKDKFFEQSSDDVSTAKARSYIKSLASDVRKTKTAIDGAGKDLVAELKALPKQIDASRKEIRDSLDALAIEIREPVTKWEAEQEELKRLEKGRIDTIEIYKTFPQKLIGKTSKEIKSLLETFALNTEEYFQDKYEEAKTAFEESKNQAETILKQAIDAEEAETLRKEKEQKERDEAIKKEAEEKAKKEIELAELRQKEAEQRAKQAEELAEKQAKEAAEKAKQDEINRQKAEQQKKLEEEQAREADIENKKRVAAGIVSALMSEGLEKSQATKVSQALFRGRIPNIKVIY